MYAKELFEKAKTGKELKDIQDLVDEITSMLQAPFFYEWQARTLIHKVNEKHGENVAIYNLITHRTASSTRNNETVSVDSAKPDELRQDLEWKHFYLSAKLSGKTIEEVEKEWKKARN